VAGNAIKGLTIKIGADTTGLDTALKDIEKAGKNTVTELKEVGRALKTSPDSVTLWEQKQKLLNTALEDSRKKLKLLEDSQEQVNEKFQKGDIGEETYRAFQRETEYARAEVEKYGRQLDEAESKVDEFRRASDSAADEVEDLGDEAREAGRQAETSSEGYTVMKDVLANLVADGIRLAGSALKDFTKDVIDTGMTFEAQMSGVGAISGATAGEMELLNDKAKEMGATTKFTAAQSGEAFEYMAMAGWKTEEMLSGIDGILALAAASGEDLGTTSDIVTDALTAFGLTASDAGHFADVLAAASSNANTNVSMMGETFKYVAPIAGSLGYSAEDTAEAIGIMANSGIKASQAGTALRTIMSNLTSDFTIQGDAIGEVTVKTQNADGSMRDFSEILSDTRAAFDGLTESEKAQQAETLVGKNAMSGFLALVNAAPGDVSKLTEAITNCDGAAQGMSETMVDNLQGDMTLLDSAVDGMKIGLSEELTPVLRDTVQYVTKQMPAIKETLTPIFKTGAEGVSFLVKNIPTAVSMLKTATPVIAGVGAAFGAWKIAGIVDSATLAIKGLNLAMLANPAVAATAGVVALTAAITALTLASKDEKSIADEVAEEYKEQRQAIEDTRDSIEGMKNDFNDRAKDIESETARTESLWKELDNLTDASGRVQDADRVRAEYILGELNDALGTEYSMTGNQIDNYKNLAAEIDTVIAKKKAEAYLDDYLAMSSGMAKNKEEAAAQYSELYSQKTEKEKEMNAAAADFERLTGFTVNEYDPAKFADDHSGFGMDHYSEAVEAAERYLRAKESVGEIRADMNIARASYMEAVDYMTKLDEAETAFAEERYDDISGILYAQEDANAAILKDEEATLDERTKAYDEAVAKMTASMSLAVKSGSQAEIDAFLGAVEETVKIGQEQLGKKGSALFSDEFKTGVQQMLDEGYDISALSEWAKDSGVDVGDVFKDDFSEVVQKQLDKAYDIGDLLRWGLNSGEDVGDEFKKNYTTIVQDQLDKGYDIQELLKWGLDTGSLTGDEFIRLFRQNAQNGFDSFDDEYNGVDIVGLIRWAEKTGREIGDVFGENLRNSIQEWTQDLYEHNELINENSINSESDARYMREKGVVSWSSSHYATGGFLGIGHEGIVAEAGPELLEVMNGGVRITPLTRNAQNTPVQTSPGGAGGTTKIYNNTVTAVIKGSYDVYRLAEDMSTAERIMDNAKGV